MPREYKEYMIRELAGQIAAAPGIFVSGFSGISAGDMNALRRKLAGCSAQLLVVKNRIVKLALAQAKRKGPVDFIKETTALTLVREAPERVARILVDFAKEHKGLVIRGAVLEGGTLKKEEIQELALLPSREVLLERVVLTLGAPLRRFLNIGMDSLVKFTRILDQMKARLRPPEAGREQSARKSSA